MVIDSLGAPGQGNTGRSVGGFRRGFFTSELNRVLSESTVSFFLDAHASGHDLGVMRVGYLVLLDEPVSGPVGQALRPLMERGLVRLISLDELGRLAPFMRTSFEGDEEAGLLGLGDVRAALFSPQSGYLDVEKVVSLYYERLVEMGVEFMFDTRVESLVLEPVRSIGHPREPLAWQEKRFGGVETSRGPVEAERILAATGAWINELLDPLGIDAHVKPKKRQVFVVPAEGGLREFFSVEGFNEFGCLPMTFIQRGPYVVPRLREGALWLGMSDGVGRPWGIDLRAEEEFYLDNIYPIMSKFFPSLSGRRPSSMWAGCYSINTIDENPIVFRELNLVVATGGSGSGVMKCDAIGRVAAALLAGEEEVELYGGWRVRSDALGVRGRRAEPELLVF